MPGGPLLVNQQHGPTWSNGIERLACNPVQSRFDLLGGPLTRTRRAHGPTGRHRPVQWLKITQVIDIRRQRFDSTRESTVRKVAEIRLGRAGLLNRAPAHRVCGFESRHDRRREIRLEASMVKWMITSRF